MRSNARVARVVRTVPAEHPLVRVITPETLLILLQVK